jgi:hypothetical protein
MRKSSILHVLIAIIATGCVRAPTPTINTQLTALKGHPIQQVFDKLGNPDGESDPAGEKTYLWSLSSVYGAISSRCSIKVVADKDEIIRNYDFEGTNLGCSFYAHKLDRTYKLGIEIIDDSFGVR